MPGIVKVATTGVTCTVGTGVPEWPRPVVTVSWVVNSKTVEESGPRETVWLSVISETAIVGAAEAPYGKRLESVIGREVEAGDDAPGFADPLAAPYGVPESSPPLRLPTEVGVDGKPSVMVITVTCPNGMEAEVLAGGKVTTTVDANAGVTVRTLPLFPPDAKVGNSSPVVAAAYGSPKSVAESTVTVTTIGKVDERSTVGTAPSGMVSQRVETSSVTVTTLDPLAKVVNEPSSSESDTVTVTMLKLGVSTGVDHFTVPLDELAVDVSGASSEIVMII